MSEQNHNVSCYAIRRMDPFLGVLQIIESSLGRATYTNGVAWEIEPLEIISRRDK